MSRGRNIVIEIVKEFVQAVSSYSSEQLILNMQINRIVQWKEHEDIKRKSSW